MNKKIITVITTVHNGEEFILETLINVKNQTFQSFEHIIVDDGSTDNTVEIIKNFQAENSGYPLYLYSPQKLGRGKALNFAISKAKCDWIAVIDADDVWHPQKLEIQQRIIQDKVVDLLATDAVLFSDLKDVRFENKLYCDGVTNYTLKDLLYTNMLSHSSVLIKKELCVYDENRKSQFDYELWLRLAENKYILSKCSIPLTYHRIHNNQSFEGKMKKAYRVRAYKMKIKSGIKNGEYLPLIYSTCKLIFDLTFPRKIRLTIKKILK